MPSVTDRVASRASGDWSTLSPRELEVLVMMSRGLTNAEIAAELGKTVHAVKFHLASIFRKLGVANRTEAAVAFLRSQQVSADKAG